jgi:putative hydrolase of the HAD superfamily
MKLKRPGAVLFDLDGTIVDRRGTIGVYVHRFAQRFQGHLGRITLKNLERAIQKADGDGYVPRDALFARLQAELLWQAKPSIEELRTHWNSDFRQCSQPSPGLYEVLDFLTSHGVSLGIVTNGPDDTQNEKIDVLGVRPYMATVITSESAGVSKPEPGIFLQALDQLHVQPSQAWYVGDHPTFDVVGAAAAGLTALWLRGKFPWPEGSAHPQFQLKSLHELLFLSSWE